MMKVSEIKDWLDSLPSDVEIGITDGGMLLADESAKNWLEVGALPEGSEGANL